MPVLELLREPEMCVHQSNVYSSARAQQLLFLYCVLVEGLHVVMELLMNMHLLRAGLQYCYCPLHPLDRAFTSLFAPSLHWSPSQPVPGIRRVSSLTINIRQILAAVGRPLFLVFVFCVLREPVMCVSVGTDRRSGQLSQPTFQSTHECNDALLHALLHAVQSSCLSFHSL